jgi:hypothetical protein
MSMHWESGIQEFGKLSGLGGNCIIYKRILIKGGISVSMLNTDNVEL